MNWYYVEAGQQAGPVDDAQLQGLVQTGRITGETLVWREGMANWLPYSEATAQAAPAAPGLRLAGAADSATGTGAASGASVAPEAVCAECGRLFNKQDMIRYGAVHVCAACKPVFMQKLAEGARVNTGAMHYAGFWIRFAAKFIDGLILGVFFIVPLFWIGFKSATDPTAAQRLMVFQIVVQLLYVCASAAYSIFFVGKYGATPGKMACKLVVVTAEGGKVTYGRATGRFFAEMLSGMICYIGYIMVAFDSQKRGLHDHICNTRVIYK